MDSTPTAQDEVRTRRAGLRVMDAADLLDEAREAEARAAAQEAVNALTAVFWPELVEEPGRTGH